MRAVIQRVASARVTVGGRVAGEIEAGLLALIGVANNDGPADVQYIAAKIRDLRIFERREDEERGEGEPAEPAGMEGRRRMNRSVGEAGGAVLVVSQFTLCGDARKGRRPSFDSAAPPPLARALYEGVVQALRDTGLRVATGDFQADMQVALVNDGPVTILLDSRRAF